MPTDPSKINVAYIQHVSNDGNSDGVNEILTAHAVQVIKENTIGTPPTIISFTNDDLVNGEFTFEYKSNTKVCFVSVADNEGNNILISPYFDVYGKFISIDLSTVAPITGTWHVSAWTASGPHPYASDLPESGTADFMRIWSNDLIDFKPSAPDVGISMYVIPAGTRLVLREFNVLCLNAEGVTSPCTIRLDILGSNGYVVTSATVPLTIQNTRYSIYLANLLTSRVVRQGHLLRVRVTTAGEATGVYNGIVNVTGYLIPYDDGK